MGGKLTDKQKRDQDKANQKKKEKIIEDKTFGLKNKNKSVAVQKKVDQMQNQIKNQKGGSNWIEAQKHKEKEDKEISFYNIQLPTKKYITKTINTSDEYRQNYKYNFDINSTYDSNQDHKYNLNINYLYLNVLNKIIK